VDRLPADPDGIRRGDQLVGDQLVGDQLDRDFFRAVRFLSRLPVRPATLKAGTDVMCED
jgi:hypothetical protein